MSRELLTQLRAYEGKVCIITSTEGEIFSARVLHVSDEEKDVIVDILSTDQPDRYLRMGRRHDEGTWAIPLAFITRSAREEV